MKRFLVTGAAGFIGSHSVDHLLSRGHEVLGVDNLTTGDLANLRRAKLYPTFVFSRADVTNGSEMDEIYSANKFDGVLHLAGLVSVPKSIENPDQNFSINVAASEMLGRLCVAHKVGRFVFASSSAVYGHQKEMPISETRAPSPESPYAGAKLAAEHMLASYARSYGIHVICLRYFNVYGSRQSASSPYSGVLSIFSQRLKKGLPVKLFGDGQQTRDFISVDDVANANCLALLEDYHGFGSYNICTGRAISLNEVLKICRTVYPASPSPLRAPPRKGDIKYSCGDPKKFFEVFGFRATTPFEVGLRNLLTKGE